MGKLHRDEWMRGMAVAPPRKIERVMYPLKFDDEGEASIRPNLPFRPTNLITMVEAVGIFLIDHIYIGLQDYLCGDQSS